MDKDEQVRQIKKLLHRLDSGTNVDAGELFENPTNTYVDPILAEQEREVFFKKTPQLVGLSGDLPQRNSFLTVNDLGTPILATRDQDGTFRAFVNSCRHRGVIVEQRDRGEARRFTCQFHRWTYDSEGTLVGLPKQEHFGEVDMNELGLLELPSLEKFGMLWVHPDPTGQINLKELLTQELLDELSLWNLGELEYLGNDVYDIACNWKLAMDTFGETYHFSSLHETTLYNAFHGNVQCYDTFGNNHRMLLCRREIDDMRQLPESEWNITTATLPVYWLFPNVQLMPSQEGLYLLRAYPDAKEPGRHRSLINFYLRPEISANAEMRQMFTMISHVFAQVIRDEDYAVSASQQVTANSQTLKSLVFGRNEPALHHYHATYKRVLESAK